MTKHELEAKIDELQLAMKNAEYEIDLQNKDNARLILSYLSNGFTWNMKNAALLVNLYDALKKQINGKSFKAVVHLSSLNLNMLYSTLTAIQSTGVETARNYVTLLTNVGSQISTAMEEMTEKNKEIQDLYLQLDELQKQEERENQPVLEAETL